MAAIRSRESRNFCSESELGLQIYFPRGTLIAVILSILYILHAYCFFGRQWSNLNEYRVSSVQRNVFLITSPVFK